MNTLVASVMPTWIIYLIHLDQPMAGRNRHYIGKSKPDTLVQRIALHRVATHPTPGPIKNGAAVFLAEANDRGIEWWVSDLFADYTEGGSLERKMKRRKRASYYCQSCIQGKPVRVDPQNYVESFDDNGRQQQRGHEGEDDPGQTDPPF